MELISDLRPEALIESPPTLPSEKPAGPRLGSALLVSAIFYAVTIGVTIPIVIVLMAMKKPLDQIMLVLAGQLVAWPAAMLAGSLNCKRPWRESYAVRGFSLRLIPGVIIGCFGLSFVLNRLASAIPMPKSFEIMFKGLADGDPVLTFLVICVIAPIAEELFFSRLDAARFYGELFCQESDLAVGVDVCALPSESLAGRGGAAVGLALWLVALAHGFTGSGYHRALCS